MGCVLKNPIRSPFLKHAFLKGTPRKTQHWQLRILFFYLKNNSNRLFSLLLSTSASVRANKSHPRWCETDRQTDGQTGVQTDARHPRIVSVRRVTSPPPRSCAVWRWRSVVEPRAASCWRSARLFQCWEDHCRVRTPHTHRAGKRLPDSQERLLNWPF